MKPTVQIKPHHPAATAPVPVRRGPYFNALTDGLRSGCVLLPGDNVAEFRRLRHRLFHLHKPRTVEEARCVETIAVSHWRVARCRLEQTHFKGDLGAALSGHPDATGSLCAPDPHRLHHCGADCGLEEIRWEKSAHRARCTLSLLQKQRIQQLPSALSTELEPYTVFLEEGEPVLEQPAPMETGAEAAAAQHDRVPDAGAETAATGSMHGGIEFFKKEEPDAGAPAGAPRWSRRQRRADARRAMKSGRRAVKNQGGAEGRVNPGAGA